MQSVDTYDGAEILAAARITAHIILYLNFRSEG
jgi:hypothetical protein